MPPQGVLSVHHLLPNSRPALDSSLYALSFHWVEKAFYACGNAVDAIGIQPLGYDALATPVRAAIHGRGWFLLRSTASAAIAKVRTEGKMTEIRP
jgi:hypothetical protein